MSLLSPQIRKRLELHCTLAGVIGSLGVGAMESQLAPQYAIALVSLLFPRNRRKRSVEFVPHGMYYLRLERQVVTLYRCLVEKLVDELAFVAVGVAKTGDKSGQLAILDGELDELAFSKERKHARKVVGNRWGGGSLAECHE